MESKDKQFLLALAYTAANNKDLNHSEFIQKVEENEKLFKKAYSERPVPKAKVIKNLL